MSYSDTILLWVLIYANSLLIEVNCRRSPAAFLGSCYRNILILVPISVRRRARIYIRNRWLAGHFTGLKVGMRAVMTLQVKSVFCRRRCGCMGWSFALLVYRQHAFPFASVRCIVHRSALHWLSQRVALVIAAPCVCGNSFLPFSSYSSLGIILFRPLLFVSTLLDYVHSVLMSSPI